QERPLLRSRILQSSLIGVALLSGACTGSDVRTHPEGAPSPEGTTPHSDSVVAKRDSVVVPDSIRRPAMPLVPTPNPVRGLYVNRWAPTANGRSSGSAIAYPGSTRTISRGSIRLTPRFGNTPAISRPRR